MPTFSAFLMHSRRIILVPLLLSPLLCLEPSAMAQHGGGGGHGGGGHGGFGGHGGGHTSGGHGHSSHSQTQRSSGHWGWLHFHSHRRNVGSDSLANVGTPRSRTSAELSRGQVLAHSLPTTYIAKLPASFVKSPPEERFTAFPHVHTNFFRGRFRHFHSSGCFFNGFNQVCFFEPAWPLYACFSGFWFPFDSGFGDEGGDASDMTPSGDVMPLASPADAESQGGKSPPEGETNPAPPLRGLDLDPRFFLLILKNGAEHVVTDYWLADGYIEYISRDGTQSHIPVDSLDLDQTVRSNSARGLRFVLRSDP